MSASVLRPSARPVTTCPADWSPIVVASDGRPEADGAIRLARLIASDHAHLVAVGVVKPMPTLSLDDPRAKLLDVAEQRHAALAGALRSQLHRAIGGQLTDCDVRDCVPALEIAGAADQLHARLIVTGIGRHQLVDRTFGDETALKLARAARVPVLAVPTAARALPRRLVIATDFSATSTRALVEAIMLAGEEAFISVVHVAPRGVLGVAAASEAREYLDSVNAGFKSLRHKVVLRSDMRAEYILLRGDPAKELLAYGESVGADLIATGSQGHGFLARTILGSVSTSLLRGARCSVLVCPYLPPPGRDIAAI